MCVCGCVHVCVSLFLHDNSKSKLSSSMKLEFIVVYENISGKFEIGHCRTTNFFIEFVLNIQKRQLNLAGSPASHYAALLT